MSHIPSKDPQTDKARELLQQGHRAYENWEINQARLLWRKAAVTDPANEEIWWALLDVAQTDDDRVVCLQNILILNPQHTDAQHRLQLLQKDSHPIEVQAEPQQIMNRPTIRNHTLIRKVFTGFLIVLAGILTFVVLVQSTM